MPTLTLTIAAGTDDAILNDSAYDDSSATMAVGGVGTSPLANHGIGFRFQNVTIPVGSTVNSAYVQLVKDGTQFSQMSCRWTAIDEDNTATFSTGDPPGARVIVSASIAQESLNVNETDGTTYGYPTTSPLRATLGAAIQAVISRPGWASGNALAIVVNSDQDASAYATFARKNFRTYNFGTPSANAPKLVIDYNPPPTPTPPFRMGVDPVGGATTRVVGGTLVSTDPIFSGAGVAGSATGGGTGIAHRTAVAGSGGAQGATGAGAGLQHRHALAASASASAATGTGGGLSSAPTRTLSSAGASAAATGAGAGIAHRHTIAGSGTAQAAVGAGDGVRHRHLLAGSSAASPAAGAGSGLAHRQALSGTPATAPATGAGAGATHRHATSGAGSAQGAIGSGVGVRHRFGVSGAATAGAATGGTGGTTAVPPMPLVSQGLPAESNNGYGGPYDADNAVDGDYNTAWRSVTVPSGGAPQWLAVDLAGLSPAERSHLVAHWRNDAATYDFWDNGANTSYVQPEDYTIEGHPGEVLGAPAFALQNYTDADQLGPDGYTWAQGNPIVVDKFGQIVQIAQIGSSHTFVWSSDGGANWDRNGTSWPFLQRGSIAYDSRNDIFHVLWQATSGSDGMIYRRYTPSRDGSNNLTGFSQVAGINLQLEADGAIGTYLPVLIWLDDADYGTYGALVAIWGASNASQGQVHAAMRVLSNTTADHNGANWRRLDGGTSGDTGLIASTYGVPTTAVTAAQGTHVGVAAARKRAGTNVGDLYVAYLVHQGECYFLRFPWQPSTDNWGAPTAPALLFDAITGSGRTEGQEFELLSKWAEDVGGDAMYVAGSRWDGATNGETWSVYRVDAADTIAKLADAHSVGGQFQPADYALTGDIAFDNTSGTLISAHVTSGAGTNDAVLRVYDRAGTLIQSATVFTTADVDIPLIWQDPLTGACRYGSGSGKLLLAFRDTDGYPATAPPYRGWFGTVATVGSGGSAPAIGWTTIVAATGNEYSSRQHDLGDCSPYRWLRLAVTASHGAVANDDVALQLDLHDASGGDEDNLIALGDSITAEVWKANIPGGGTWSGGTIAQRVEALLPGRTPLYQNGGTGTKTIDWAYTNRAALLAGFVGRYVVLAYGTNDAAGAVADTDFYADLLNLIDYVEGLGLVAIVPRLWKRTDNAGIEATVQSYNAKIALLPSDRPGVLIGPDFHALVDDGTIALRDGLHPTTAGAEAAQAAWAAWLAANLYTGSAPSIQHAVGNGVAGSATAGAAVGSGAGVGHRHAVAGSATAQAAFAAGTGLGHRHALSGSPAAAAAQGAGAGLGTIASRALSGAAMADAAPANGTGIAHRGAVSGAATAQSGAGVGAGIGHRYVQSGGGVAGPAAASGAGLAHRSLVSGAAAPAAATGSGGLLHRHNLSGVAVAGAAVGDDAGGGVAHRQIVAGAAAPAEATGAGPGVRKYGGLSGSATAGAAAGSGAGLRHLGALSSAGQAQAAQGGGGGVGHRSGIAGAASATAPTGSSGGLSHRHNVSGAGSTQATGSGPGLAHRRALAGQGQAVAAQGAGDGLTHRASLAGAAAAAAATAAGSGVGHRSGIAGSATAQAAAGSGAGVAHRHGFGDAGNAGSAVGTGAGVGHTLVVGDVASAIEMLVRATSSRQSAVALLVRGEFSTEAAASLLTISPGNLAVRSAVAIDWERGGTVAVAVVAVGQGGSEARRAGLGGGGVRAVGQGGAEVRKA